MYSMAAEQSFSWPDAAAVTALALAVVALVGFAIAGFVQLRTSKIKAGQEDNLRQLVRRYEHLAESTFDAQQRTATDLSEMRSRTVSIEQMLRTVVVGVRRRDQRCRRRDQRPGDHGRPRGVGAGPLVAIGVPPPGSPGRAARTRTSCFRRPTCCATASAMDAFMTANSPRPYGRRSTGGRPGVGERVLVGDAESNRRTSLIGDHVRVGLGRGAVSLDLLEVPGVCPALERVRSVDLDRMPQDERVGEPPATAPASPSGGGCQSGCPRAE